MLLSNDRGRQRWCARVRMRLLLLVLLPGVAAAQATTTTTTSSTTKGPERKIPPVRNCVKSLLCYCDLSDLCDVGCCCDPHCEQTVIDAFKKGMYVPSKWRLPLRTFARLSHIMWEKGINLPLQM